MKKLSTSIVLVLVGCATTGQTGLIDFNKKFGLDIPTSPQYKVSPIGKTRYQVTVYQGGALISEATTRQSFLQQAAFVVMEDQCRKNAASLTDYQVNSSVDGWGYVNLLAVFNCS